MNECGGGSWEWRLVLANELTRSRAGVMGLFWLRRKPRSRERKWLLHLCVFLYIDAHRLPHTSEPLEPCGGGVGWLGAGCRAERGGAGADDCRRDRWCPAALPRESFWHRVVLSLCSFRPANQKSISHPQLPASPSADTHTLAVKRWPRPQLPSTSQSRSKNQHL